MSYLVKGSKGHLNKIVNIAVRRALGNSSGGLGINTFEKRIAMGATRSWGNLTTASKIFQIGGNSNVATGSGASTYMLTDTGPVVGPDIAT